MSPVKQNALNLIHDGNWVFDLILPIFKTELESQTGGTGKNQSISQLTLAAYLQVKQVKATHFPETISISYFEEGDMAQRLATNVYSAGVAADFTELEQEAIDQTCTIFLKTKPDLFHLVQRIFSGFFRVHGGSFSGASLPHAYGFYFAGDKFFNISTEERCLSLVHELAHHELFLLNLVDRLVEKAADHQLRFASFQGKARPPIGRLHSIAAIFRMLQFSAYFSGNQEFLKTKFKETRLSFEKGELTEFGELLVSNMENYLGALNA